jgi:hypothetical protein
MILASFITSKLLTLLTISLIVLVGIIIYKRTLSKFKKNTIDKENYCVLFGLENQPSKGEVEFFFTSEKSKNVKINLLKLDMSLHTVIKELDCTVGGNIVRFNTTVVEDGDYFYQLLSDNQNTMKKFTIKNN